jgi:Glycosyl hydrolases family 28
MRMNRREWLGTVTAPAMAAAMMASLGGTMAEGKARRPEDNKAEAGARVYSIRDYGAKGDGETVDTAALQAAIDACTNDGGGTVLVPAGTFVIGTAELKSNVTLHIAASGTLLGSADGRQYHAVDAIPLTGDHTIGDGNWALIFAVHATNFAIEGPGTIDGQGAQFHSKVRGTPPPSGLGGNKRPYHVLLYRCQDFAVRNISLVNGAYHSVRVIQSQRGHMDCVYIHNRVNGNNDGFHFISAEHVTVSNCIVKSQDDACAMFGSCKNMTITNSYFSTRWSVFRFGGGNVENIAVSNCVLQEVYGCPVKFHAGADCHIENLSFSDLVFDNVTGPINFSIGPGGPRNPMGAAQQSTNGAATSLPVVRNVSFSNIHGTVTTDPAQLTEASVTSGYRPGERFSCITLNAVGGATLENISFENIHLTFGGGGTAEDGARRDLPETAGEYFALGPMPAYGFYARNVRGITLDNIRFEVSTPDLRPAVILDNVEDVAISGLAVQGNSSTESMLRFTAAKEVLITAPRLLTAAGTYLQLDGTDNKQIVIDGGDLSKASTALAVRDGASEDSVKLRL